MKKRSCPGKEKKSSADRGKEEKRKNIFEPLSKSVNLFNLKDISNSSEE